MSTKYPDADSIANSVLDGSYFDAPAAPVPSAGKGSAPNVPAVIDDEFAKLGYPATARLSILGDVGRENGWNANTIFKGHSDPKNGAYNRGIISWQGRRQTDLTNHLKAEGVHGTGGDDELRGMVRFMDNEMQTKFPGVRNALLNATSTSQASRALQHYIKYDPGHGYNSPDPNFVTKNNAQWAAKAQKLGLAQDQPVDTDAIAQSYINGDNGGVDTDAIAQSYIDGTAQSNLPRVPGNTTVVNPTGGTLKFPKDGPVPETDATLNSQRQAAADPNSTRIATLYTAGANDPVNEDEIDIPISHGQVLRANIGKLMQYVQSTGTSMADIRSGRADFTPLIGGKAQPTGEPFGAHGQIAVMSVDENGHELVSSTVSDPTAVPVEAALHAKQFPGQQITTKVVTGQDVVNHRLEQHAKAAEIQNTDFPPAGNSDVQAEAPTQAAPADQATVPTADQGNQGENVDVKVTDAPPQQTDFEIPIAPKADVQASLINAISSSTGAAADDIQQAIKKAGWHDLDTGKEVGDVRDQVRNGKLKVHLDDNFYNALEEAKAQRLNNGSALLQQQYATGAYDANPENVQKAANKAGLSDDEIQSIVSDPAFQVQTAKLKQTYEQHLKSLTDQGMDPEIAQVHAEGLVGFKSSDQVKKENAQIPIERDALARAESEAGWTPEDKAAKSQEYAKWKDNVLSKFGSFADANKSRDEIAERYKDKPFLMLAAKVPALFGNETMTKDTDIRNMYLPDGSRLSDSEIKDAEDFGKGVKSYLDPLMGIGQIQSGAATGLGTDVLNMAAGTLRYASPILNWATGGGAATWLDRAAKQTAIVGQSASPDGTVGKILHATGEGFGQLPGIAGTTILAGGNPIIGFALHGGLSNSGKPIEQQTSAVIKDATMGAIFEGASVFGEAIESGTSTLLKKFGLDTAEIDALGAMTPAARKAAMIETVASKATRAVTLGGIGGASAAAEGADAKDSWNAAISFALMDFGISAFGHKPTSDEWGKLEGKIVRLPDNEGKPTDVLIHNGEAVEVQAPDGVQQAVIAPKEVINRDERRASASVPETPAEPEATQYTSALDEIRQRDLRTKVQIQEAFPQLSREEAADYRRQAWENADTGALKPNEANSSVQPLVAPMDSKPLVQDQSSEVPNEVPQVAGSKQAGNAGVESKDGQMVKSDPSTLTSESFPANENAPESQPTRNANPAGATREPSKNRLVDEQKGVNEKDATSESRAVSHPDPAIDGKPVVAQTDDGKVVVVNPENKSGVSVVTDHGQVEGKSVQRGVDDTGKRLVSLFQSDVKTNSGQHKVVIGPVSETEALRLRNDANIELDGTYRHVADKSALNHILKEHGDVASENERGLVAVTADDIRRIPEILASPDGIRNVGKSDAGLDRIEYSKRFNGHTIYVEEVRRKRHDLALVTMFKKKGISDDRMPEPPVYTPEAAAEYDHDKPAPQDNQGINETKAPESLHPGKANPEVAAQEPSADSLHRDKEQVNEQSRSKVTPTAIDAPRKAKVAAAKKIKDSGPLSLSQYVRQNGGIKSTKYDKGEHRRISNKETGTTGLINNKSGKSAQIMAESAWQDGYLRDVWPDISDINGNDLMDHVENDHRGIKKHYAQAHYEEFEKDIPKLEEEYYAQKDESARSNDEYSKRQDDLLTRRSEAFNDPKVKELVAKLHETGDYQVDRAFGLGENELTKQYQEALRKHGIDDESTERAILDEYGHQKASEQDAAESSAVNDAREPQKADVGQQVTAPTDLFGDTFNSQESRQNNQPQTDLFGNQVEPAHQAGLFGDKELSDLNASALIKQRESLTDVFGKDTGAYILSLTESPDRDIVRVAKDIADAVKFVDAKGENAKSIVENASDALDLFVQAKNDKQTIEEQAQQPRLDGVKYSPQAISLARAMALGDFGGEFSKALSETPSARLAGLTKLDKHWVPETLWKKHFSKLDEFKDLKGEERNAALREVVPAFLTETSEKDLSAMGITPSLAADYILKSFESHAERHGIDSLDNFDKGETNVQNIDAPATPNNAQNAPAADSASAEQPSQAGPGDEANHPVESVKGGEDRGDKERDSGSPVEPVKDEKASSIKNWFIDDERQKRGLDPITKKFKQSWGEAAKLAMERVDRNPDAARDLVKELVKNPRAVDDVEGALLDHHRLEIQGRYDDAVDAVNKSAEGGDASEKVSAQQRLAKSSDDLLEIDKVSRDAGTYGGRGLNFRKAMLKEDFSLVNLERQKRAVNGGRQLTEAERSVLQKTADDLRARVDELETHVKDRESRIVQMRTEMTLNSIEKSAHAPHILAAAERIVGRLEKQADIERAKLRKRGDVFTSGLDPEALVSLAKIGAAHIGRVGLDFAQFSSRMIEEFGPKIKEHLHDIYDSANKLIENLGTNKSVIRVVRKETTVETLAAKVKDKLDVGDRDISHHVREIAKRFVKSGITDREKLIDAVHGALKTDNPQITRRETMDAISGYGAFKPLSKDEIDVRLRDLKGQMQQVGKLEDMSAGMAPAKTGVERRAPSDEERQLIQQVEAKKKEGGYSVRLRDLKGQMQQVEAKKKEGGYSVTDPETQLKTALEAVKTRLTNQIADLEKQIQSREKIVRERKGVQYDTEALTLKSRRDELKSQFDEVFGKDTRQMTDDQRLAAWKKRTNDRIGELQDRIANEDFSKKPRRGPVPLDDEGTRLKVAVEGLKKQFQFDLAKDRAKNRSRSERYMDYASSYVRGGMLTGITSLGKLTSAALERTALLIPEQAVGGVYSKMFPNLAKKALMEGGFNVRAEAKAVTGFFMKGLADSAKILRTGSSDLSTVYGNLHPPRTWLEFAGTIHGALKAPAKRAGFERSFEIRTQKYMEAGVDVNDPLVQMRIGLEAYRDAERAIFMGDNRIVTAYRSAMRTFEMPDETGHVPLGSKAVATIGKILLPIISVPTNIAIETGRYTGGALVGALRLAAAYKRGIETLSPEQAESILRQLKKGSVGAAGLAIGFFSPNMFGGYYQPGEKRDDADVKAGTVRLFGVNLPTWAVHNPLLETFQIGATAARVMDSYAKKSDKHPQGLAAGVAAALLGLAEEIPFVRETVELSKLFDPRERDQFVGNFVKSRVVPQALQQVAAFTDKNPDGQPFKRKPEGIIQNIESGLPYLRQHVPMAYDTLDKRGVTAEDWVKSKSFQTKKISGVVKQIAEEKAAGNDVSTLMEALKAKAEKRIEAGKFSPSDASKVNAILDLSGDAALKPANANGTEAEADDPEEFKSEKGFFNTLGTYAEALTTDPVTAFKHIYHGETIRMMKGGSIIVERMPMNASEAIKRQRMGGKEMRLDHTVPLEIGGDNSDENLKLVPKEVWESYTPVENALGKALQQKKIDGTEAKRLITDFKDKTIGTKQIADRLGVPEESLQPKETKAATSAGGRAPKSGIPKIPSVNNFPGVPKLMRF